MGTDLGFGFGVWDQGCVGSCSTDEGRSTRKDKDKPEDAATSIPFLGRTLSDLGLDLDRRWVGSVDCGLSLAFGPGSALDNDARDMRSSTSRDLNALRSQQNYSIHGAVRHTIFATRSSPPLPPSPLVLTLTHVNDRPGGRVGSTVYARMSVRAYIESRGGPFVAFD